MQIVLIDIMYNLNKKLFDCKAWKIAFDLDV